MNEDRWVDDRLSALDAAGEWQPDAARARAGLLEWDRRAKLKRRWAWAAGAVACFGLLAFLQQPRACATPLSCVKGAAPRQSAGAVPVTAPATAPVTAPANTPAAKPQASAPAPQVPAVPDFKKSGSPNAPISCEIYSDYQCPACAVFFRDTLPLLIAEYVQTGKVKLIHRDFPLPMHAYAKLAARYANAAGEAGEYGAATAQLFNTQQIWAKTGDVDAQLAAALTPEIMRTVRGFVEGDGSLDEGVAADQAMGAADQINATPTVVVVWKGKRQLMPGLSYSLLKSYLDDLLARQ